MAVCPNLGESLLIFNNVHYYPNPRLVTADCVYTHPPPPPYRSPSPTLPHSSEPAGRALNLSLLHFNSTSVLLLPPVRYYPPVQIDIFLPLSFAVSYIHLCGGILERKKCPRQLLRRRVSPPLQWLQSRHRQRLHRQKWRRKCTEGRVQVSNQMEAGHSCRH